MSLSQPNILLEFVPLLTLLSSFCRTLDIPTRVAHIHHRYFAANRTIRKRDFHTREYCLSLLQPPACAVISSSAICHAPNFPTILLTRLVWLCNCDCQIRFVSREPNSKIRPSSANRHQYCRSPGQSWKKCFRVFIALF